MWKIEVTRMGQNYPLFLTVWGTVQNLDSGLNNGLNI